MTTTRAAIRRRAVFLAKTDGRSRGLSTRDASTALTATSGTASTLIDTGGLPPVGAAESMSRGWWIMLPTMTAANRRRIVGGAVSYSAANSALGHLGPDYDSTTIAALVAGSCPYLLLKDDPDLWDSAINEAVRTLISSIHYDEFTPTTSGTGSYNVASAPITLTGIVRVSQILDIERRDPNDVAGQERWEPWANGYRTWRAYEDEGTVILDFIDPARAPTTTDRLRIKWASQFAVTTTETASIATDEYLAALGTLVVMADWLADPNNPDDDWNIIGRRIREQYATQRRLILGQDAYRQVGRSAQQAGIVGVRGRGGR